MNYKNILDTKKSRWQIKWRVSKRMGFGLGFDSLFVTDAYPWITLIFCLGPFLFSIDIVAKPLSDFRLETA